MSDLRCPPHFVPAQSPSFAPQSEPASSWFAKPWRAGNCSRRPQVRPEPEPARGADQSGGPFAGPFRADGLYPQQIQTAYGINKVVGNGDATISGNP